MVIIQNSSKTTAQILMTHLISRLTGNIGAGYDGTCLWSYPLGGRRVRVQVSLDDIVSEVS